MGRGSRESIGTHPTRRASRPDKVKKLSIDERRIANQAWLNKYIEKNGPYLYHRTPVQNVESILKTGIIPTDERTSGDGFLAPRPNHVYLASNESIPFFLNDAETLERTQVLQIDIRALDPGYLSPDEDYVQSILGRTLTDYESPYLTIATESQESPVKWRAELRDTLRGRHPEEYVDYVMENISQDKNPNESRPYSSLGEWAEGNDIGNAPSLTEDSLVRSNSIAYKGEIPPKALKAVRVEHDEDFLHRMINLHPENKLYRERLKEFKESELPVVARAPGAIQQKLRGDTITEIELTDKIPFIEGERVHAAKELVEYDFSLNIIEEDGKAVEGGRIVSNWGNDINNCSTAVLNVRVEAGRIKEITNPELANEQYLENEKLKRAAIEALSD